MNGFAGWLASGSASTRYEYMELCLSLLGFPGIGEGKDLREYM